MAREAEKRLTPMLCQAVTRLAYLGSAGDGSDRGTTNPAKPDMGTIVGTGKAAENILPPRGADQRLGLRQDFHQPHRAVQTPPGSKAGAHHDLTQGEVG